MGRRLQQVGADLVVGEVVDRQVRVLVQELRVAAVDDGLPREDRPDPARRVLEPDQAAWLGQLAVEDTARPLPEGAGADREGHGTPFVRG
jgi:hypothetical protein